MLDVRRISDTSGPRILAARFDWMTGSNGDALDQYLYGSNAQWRFQRLTERGNTPIETIRTHFHRRPDLAPFSPTFDWRLRISVPNDVDQLVEVLASTDDTSGRVYKVLSDSDPESRDYDRAHPARLAKKDIMYYEVEIACGQ